MLTKELYITGTDITPFTHFKPDGTFIIKGRAFRTLKEKVPQELWEWLDLYVKDPAEETIVTLAFEYINTVSTSVLFNIISILLKVVPSKKLIINWYYEPDDEDMLERGEFVSNSLNYPFNFIKTRNINQI